MTQPPHGGPTPPADNPHRPAWEDPGYPAADRTPPAQEYPPAVDPYAATDPYAGAHRHPADPYAAGDTAATDPTAPENPAYVPYFPAQPPRRSRRGLLIGAIVAVVLLFCVGGGVSAWLLLPRLERGEGATEPVAAVDSFLTAVYTDKDPDRAAELVCSEARDEEAIARKVDEIRGYDQKYESPRFEWGDPRVDDENEERAIVSVTLTVTTADERTAEQDLRFTVVRKTGWWVCEVG